MTELVKRLKSQSIVNDNSAAEKPKSAKYETIP